MSPTNEGSLDAAFCDSLVEKARQLLNERTAGAAYYLLGAAVECASVLGDDHRLRRLEALAAEWQTIIDTTYPDHQLSLPQQHVVVRSLSSPHWPK